MDEITELAEKLGKAISQSPQAKNLRAARQAMEQTPELAGVLKEHRTQLEKIARLEAENKPVEVEDKHKLQALHEKLIGSEQFKRFQAVQVEYADLMRRVNQALSKHLAETESE